MELEPKSANVFYSYAMSLSFRGKKTEALAEIDKAIEFYGEDSTRINAIALGARTAAELGDDAKVQRYYALADEDYPDSPTPGVLRHMVAIETGNKSAASDAADSLVSAYGSNPNVIRTLISTWYSAGDATAARDFLQRNIAKGGEDLTVATLNFYLVVLLSQGSPSDEDRAVALKALDEAEARFKTVFGPENQVYGVITDMRASLQPKAPDPAPGAGAQ